MELWPFNCFLCVCACVASESTVVCMSWTCKILKFWGPTIGSAMCLRQAYLIQLVSGQSPRHISGQSSSWTGWPQFLVGTGLQKDSSHGGGRFPQPSLEWDALKLSGPQKIKIRTPAEYASLMSQHWPALYPCIHLPYLAMAGQSCLKPPIVWEFISKWLIFAWILSKFLHFRSMHLIMQGPTWCTHTYYIFKSHAIYIICMCMDILWHICIRCRCKS